MPPTKTIAGARVAAPQTPAEQHGAAIRAALAGGADASALRLHLTRRDEDKLRRDPRVAMEDIRYADGEMRFLGVKVVSGEVSELRTESA